MFVSENRRQLRPTREQPLPPPPRLLSPAGQKEQRTPDVFRGLIGAPDRYNYTAVGETVNIAARLEGVPEDYGCRIVVGPNTAAAIVDRFVLCELDWIKVKGKDTAFSVYQLIGEKSAANGAELASLAQYEAGLNHYRAGDFAVAEEIWRQGDHHPNPGANASSPPLVMAGRCTSLKTAPPEPWDGVYVRTTK